MKSTESSDIETLKEFLNFPLGSANDVLTKFAKIPGAIRCGNGNRLEQFVFIEGSRNNRVLLVAHADTYWDENYDKKSDGPQELEQHNGTIRNKNGGLGADDRAGCAILWLLKDMGHSLLVTNGEEHGRKGSNLLMQNHPDIADKINKDHQFAVQLDRRNGADFKCYEVGTDEYRAYVKQQTGYSEPDKSSFTDIVTICRDICGVNLSIGYYNEHSENECIVINEWLNTLNICRKWLSNPELPRFSLHR